MTNTTHFLSQDLPTCTTLSHTMSHQDDKDQDHTKRLEKELAETRERCEKLEKAMKYSPSGESLLSKFIQATQDIHESREEIKQLKAIMDNMKEELN